MTGTTTDRWGPYDRWNAAIAEVVYGTEAAGLPAFLDMDDEVLQRAGRAMREPDGDPRASVIAAVNQSLNAPDAPSGVFGGHLERLRRWRSDSGEPPPIIALLSVLCIAAEDMRDADGFAANNYYNRLMPLFGVMTGADKNRVVNTYRRSSRYLWESLNSWLDSLRGERGLPTAYAYGHAHVSLPMSQALVRAADRDKLGEFFVELGLESRARLSPHDMELLLGGWINRAQSPASSQLRALWKRSGARERIAEVACQLLESWEAPSAVAASDRTMGRTRAASTLRVRALLRTFPSATLELNLTGAHVDGERLVHLVEPQSGADIGPAFELVDLPDGQWQLARIEQMDALSVIEGHIHLGHPSGRIFERRPRRVVPLKKDYLSQAYVEVERLGLGEDGLLLCQSALAPTVRVALEKVARPGFREPSPPPADCPAGWSVFADVQVLAPLPGQGPTSDVNWPLDLNVLFPLATSQLVLAGGLQLPGRLRRWSSLAPPEIRVAVDGAEAVEVVVARVGREHDEVTLIERRVDQAAVVVPLLDAGLPDGDYDVRANAITGNGRSQVRHVIRLRLRSGSAPSPVPPGQSLRAHVFAATPLCALTTADWDGQMEALRGVTLVGAVQGREAAPFLTASIGTPSWWTHRQDPSKRAALGRAARPAGRMLAAATSQDCFRTGAHVLELPTFYGRSSGSTIDGVCRHCGLVKRFPARYRARSDGRRPSDDAVRPPSLDVSAVVPVDKTGAVDPDVALDALCHDIAGPAAWFEQVALQVEPSQLFVDRFLRALEGLAYIDVTRDVRTLRPIAWEVVPPTLAGLHRGEWVLVGARSNRFLHELDAVAAEAGISLSHQPQGLAAPDRIALDACSTEVARAVADLVTARSGILIDVVPDAARVVASALPPLGEVIDAMPRQGMVGAAGVRRWDTVTARWQTTTDAHVPGAYQLFGATTIYCLRDEADVAAGTMRRLDARLVKHAASLAQGGTPLVGYDSATETLYLPLGADLPGLYARAAVLCGARLPVEDEKQRIVRYGGVPSDVAEHLSALLMSRGRSR